MDDTRKNCGSEFKAKVALEATRGEVTITERVAKQGVHQTVINSWKRQAHEGTAEAKAAENEGGIEKLHARIGQLGSGLVLDHNQKMTVAARAMAEKKVFGQRSYRVATRLQSLSLPNMISMRLRRLYRLPDTRRFRPAPDHRNRPSRCAR